MNTATETFFQNLISKARYQLIKIHRDNSVTTELSYDVVVLLTDAAEALQNEDCHAVEIWDFEKCEFVLNYWED